ncbi:MAG: AMP-binding protein, partial [Dehalococcoidia bacterium]
MTRATGAVEEGKLLWEPTAELIENGNITRFMRWLDSTKGRGFRSYDELWRWSVEDLEGFWGALWDYFQIKAHKPYTQVVAPSPSGNRVEGARWFTGAELNYAEHCLTRRDDHPALVFGHESGTLRTVSYAELWEMTAQAAAGLRRLGVRKGDSVVAFMPNVPEAVAAMLAAASIGAAWSSCPPEFGVSSVIERFHQLEPSVLIGVDGYT